MWLLVPFSTYTAALCCRILWRNVLTVTFHSEGFRTIDDHLSVLTVLHAITGLTRSEGVIHLTYISAIRARHLCACQDSGHTGTCIAVVRTSSAPGPSILNAPH